MADGVRLSARIWMPDDAEDKPVPAILEYIPYRKRDHTRAWDDPRHHYWAGHGYACVRLDIRGTGESEGLITDEYALSRSRTTPWKRLPGSPPGPGAAAVSA